MCSRMANIFLKFHNILFYNNNYETPFKHELYFKESLEEV